MQWCDFYDAFWDWSDSTRRTRISSLEDIGSGDEVVEAVLEIEDSKIRSQLIRKAIKLGAEFTNDDFMNLDGELADEVYEELGKYAGFDHNDPYFDEEDMDWDDFYGAYSDWNEALLLRRIHKLKRFGPADEVAEVIQCMPNSETEDLLYKKALAAGVRFTDDQMLAMGNLIEVLSKAVDTMTQQVEHHTPPMPANKKNTTATRSVTMGSPYQVVDVQILNIETHLINVLVSYTKTFGDGSRKTYRTNVKDLGGYYNFFSPKPIVAATYIDKVYCGAAGLDVRMLFVVRLNDGSVQLIQVKEGSSPSLKLLQLSEDTANGYVQPAPPPKPQVSSEPAKPYQLGKNELPQGSYLIGRDIPTGTYDFFVMYGNGGCFDLAKYDKNDEIVNGTWTTFWIGLKEDYEKRELIHIECKEGYTIKIRGNVILKIARSQQVKIDL